MGFEGGGRGRGAIHQEEPGPSIDVAAREPGCSWHAQCGVAAPSPLLQTSIHPPTHPFLQEVGVFDRLRCIPFSTIWHRALGRPSMLAQWMYRCYAMITKMVASRHTIDAPYIPQMG